MTLPVPSRLLSALLVALLAVTLAGLGQARGQVLHGDMLVICQGDRVLTIPAPDGAPGQVRHLLCPDMAPGLMLALALPSACINPVRTSASLVLPAPAVAGAGPLRLAPRARDPPLRAA